MLTRLVCAWALAGALAAQDNAAIRGDVTDPSGALVPGASVALNGPGGLARKTAANALGAYAFEGLAAGRYRIRIEAPGFTPFEVRNFTLKAGQNAAFRHELAIETSSQTVTVSDYAEVTVDPQSTAGAIVLRGPGLDILSGNPDDLESDLQALAGPSAGPNGGEIFVDGFSGSRLPPKSSIREVRINQNPFSAEFDRMGFGRIEIFTRPGAERLRGQAFYNFGDEALNTRNPFAAIEAPFQQRFFGFNVGGPVNKKASWFIDADRMAVDENAVMNGAMLDRELNPTPFSGAIVTPLRRMMLTPRLDYQIAPNHTFVARYQHMRMEREGIGAGEFTLPSRATTAVSREHAAQLTHTAVLGASMINESRYMFSRGRSFQTGDNSTFSLDVLEAFSAGGASLGLAGDTQNRHEYQNLTSITRGAHMIRFGARLRHSSLWNTTDQNFNGTFTFAGGAGMTSLERYRLTLLGLGQGLAPERIRLAGGGASQFTLTTGAPLATVAQTDAGLFAEDSWRARPNLTLNYGLRAETQNNIPARLNLAPRFSIAWGLGRGPATKTVLRTGFGMFFDRAGDTLTLQARRFDGVSQVRYFAANPDFFPNLPDVSQLAGAAVQPSIFRLDAGIKAPYVAQGMIGLDRSLPRNTSLSVNYVYSRGVNQLRARNVNAPLPGGGVRPLGGDVNVFQFESSGFFRQRQLMTNVRTRLTSKVMLFGFYVYGHANSDTDGTMSYPVDQYDMSTEYGRAAFDIRHRFMLGGSLQTRWGLNWNPFITANTGRPFNITTGKDNNGDTLFNDRPAFAANLAAPGAVATPHGAFDTLIAPGMAMIPRNFGHGPGFIAINLRLSRTWGFGSLRGAARAEAQEGPMPVPPPGAGGPGGGGPGGGGPGGGMRGGGPGGPGGPFGMGGSPDGRYTLTLSISARNLLNTTNLGPPAGNLGSPMFGLSNSLAGGFGPGGGMGAAGNRRLELALRFSF
jgi:hypothetical protein